jgi:serine/threonine protein kinase/Flp pilus assembly protein TadD
MKENLIANTTLSHYRIVKQLGAGGMGEVYLAEDTRLRRKVALKVLPTEIAQDTDRLRRFEQEAFAASALNHPNILTIHEFGVEGETHFIVSEFIDGETLRTRLQRESLSLNEALDIAVQTAQALAAAHEAHIIHRDIKPENVMIRRDSIVKVLDFGLAKLTEPVAPTSDSEAPTLAKMSTDPGTVLGTARYMSPEQARGQEVDARTDIFSLGVVLYEMIAGRPPFEGVNALDVISAILQTEPAPLTQHLAEAPRELEHLLGKSLRKDREQRYQAVKDLLIDLKDLKEELAFAAKQTRSGQAERKEPATAQAEIIPTSQLPVVTMTSSAKIILGEIQRHKLGVVVTLALLLAMVAALSYWAFFAPRESGPIESIAVLPFVNASGNAEVEYLSDGISESLIYNLSQLPQLKVIARSSAFKYKGQEADLQAVAKALGVEVVLTGKVEQRGESLIIGAELVDARHMTQLWGEHYTRKASDLLAVQAELSRKISLRLRPRLSRDEQQRVAKNHTTENESYRLYLKGRYFWNKRTPEGYEQAIESFQQATDRDPNYALAYVGLADSQAFLRVRGQSGQDAYLKAKTIVQRALEIDDTLGEAHATLAMLRQNADWDWAGAEKQYQRAIELSPNYATAHHWYGELLIQMGRVQEGLTLQKRALEIDPLSLAISSDLGLSYYYARQYDRALEQLQKTIALDPHFFRTYFYLARIYEQQRHYEKAIAEHQKGFLRSGENPERLAHITAALSNALAVSGERGYWQKRLEIRRQNPQLPSEWECDIAGIHARLGESDRAFVELEKDYQKRLFDLLFLKVSPEFDPLRGDPRFQGLVRRIGFPQ